MIDVTCHSTSDIYKDEINARLESNDCVVRAIASSFEIKYSEAHSFVKDIFKREYRKGTSRTAMKMRKLEEAFGKTVKELGIVISGEEYSGRQMKWPYKVKGEVKYASYTTAKFIKEFPTGTYFILVRGHAFTIKDGSIYGNTQDRGRAKARIRQAFKIG